MDKITLSVVAENVLICKSVPITDVLIRGFDCTGFLLILKPTAIHNLKIVASCYSYMLRSDATKLKQFCV